MGNASGNASIGNRTTHGECFYCRDGQAVTLYEHVSVSYSGGDCVPDTEWVCAPCAVWLSHDPR